MRALLSMVLLGPLLVGCLSDAGDELDPSASNVAVGYDHLTAANAVDTLDEAGVRTFVFEGAVETGGVNAVFFELPPTPLASDSFEVDGSVGYVQLLLDYDPADGELYALLSDHEDRVQCGAATDGLPKVCTVPVPNATALAEWQWEIVPGVFGAMPGMGFTVEASLHPASQLTFGDPRVGVDETIAFRVSDTGAPGAEPTLGVLSDGTVFVQENLATMRSTDDGITWENVAPASTSIRSFDPMLRVDPWSDTVYVDQLTIACSILAWSSDGGDTWSSNPAACGLPGNDHQKLAVGPNPLPVPFNAVYYAFSSFGDGVYVSRSLDGGVTWTAHYVTSGLEGVAYKNTGPVEADRDGTVFVPYYLCDGGMGVGVSHDYGASYAYLRILDDAITCQGTNRTDSDGGPAYDTAGNLYIAYRTDEGVRFVHSEDKGDTWSEPVTVSPSGLLSFVHVDAVAGDQGRLAIVYRATPDSDIGPNSDGWAAWHTYVAFVENATSPTPSVRTALVNDPGDPVQRGPICTMGAACAGGSRNLLDFIDIAVGPDGRVYVAYADGCDMVCPTPADSRERLGIVGIQEAGPRLFENGAPWT